VHLGVNGSLIILQSLKLDLPRVYCPPPIELVSQKVIGGFSSNLKIFIHTNMASCTTSFRTNLEKSKMAAKQPAKIGFQAF
jgi:hypothetical protein